MTRPENFDEYPIDTDEDIYGISASSYDMTGLIPRGIESEDEFESYEEVYPFLDSEEEHG